uniref:hypothetical protein n=1 Tax=Agathobacter sp. TaxID=2021311 RepID=UPI004056008F
MDDIIAFFVELVLDILLESSMEAGKNKKLPKWVRVLALLVLLTVSGGMVGIFLYIAYEALQEGDMAAGAVSCIIAMGLAVFLIWGFVSKYREARKKREDRQKPLG